MTARHHWFWLAGIFATGVTAGAIWPPPPLPKLVETGDGWSLPSTMDIARHSPQDMAAVTSGLRWKGDAGGLAGERSAWRLAGIVNDAGPAILVMTPGISDKAQRIGIGEALPDGSLLNSVQDDRATTKHGTCITTYQLFQAQAVDKSGECEEMDVPDQGTNE